MTRQVLKDVLPAAGLAVFGLVPAACSQAVSPIPPPGASSAVTGFRAFPETASCTWTRVATPNNGTDFGDQSLLSAVATRTASDVWAVGYFVDYGSISKPSLIRTVTEHWDGSRWKIVRSRNVGTDQSELFGVTTVGAHDVWAVGYSRPPGISSSYETLIEHWNGHAWSVAQSKTEFGVLNAVAATGPNDVWAVGTTNYPGYGVIEHYDGKTWTYSTLKFVALFRAVAAISPTDVWAVGEKTVGYADKTLTYHFDGKRWHLVRSPSPLHLHYSDQNWLTAVVPKTPNDIWAVGVMRNTDYGMPDQPFSEHWNGHRWRVVNMPAPGGPHEYNDVWGATSFGHDIMAVGLVGQVFTVALTEEWNGKAWLPSVAPQNPQSFDDLQAVAPDGAGGLWAVGDQALKAYVLGALAERCVG